MIDCDINLHSRFKLNFKKMAQNIMAAEVRKVSFSAEKS